MKIVLLEDVKKQGKKHDVIDVSDGYANNYLIKNKLAVPYTKENKEKLESKLELQKEEKTTLIKNLIKEKEKLEKEKLEFFSSKGKDNKIFGSISTKQIREKLIDMGYNIGKNSVVIDSPIDHLGTHKVKIILHKEVIAIITVKTLEK